MAEERIPQISTGIQDPEALHIDGQVIVHDEHGQPIGIEEVMSKQEALIMGLMFLLFGGVFFFMPLGMMLQFLQDAAVGEMFCIVPFFSVFLLIGAAMLAGGLKATHAGVTGKGLTETVTFEELEERREKAEATASSFSYTSREELLAQIHGSTSSQPSMSNDPVVIDEAGESETPSNAFWDVSEG